MVPPPVPGRAGAPGDGAPHIDVVRAGLPETLRPHLVTCLLRPEEIVLFAASAAWATRLRLAAVEAAEAGAFDAICASPRITVRITPQSQAR
ncbi:MAG: hypothetical protein U1F39_01525 [Steroidobacteraceae bacterium]